MWQIIHKSFAFETSYVNSYFNSYNLRVSISNTLPSCHLYKGLCNTITFLSNNNFRCKFCSANISTISNLKRHYNRAHNVEKEMFCQECSIPFRKKNRYEEHMASHRNSSLYKCDKCGKMFLTHMKLKKHHLTHIPKSYKCPIANCTEVFEKWALMVEHKKSHKPGKFNQIQPDLQYSKPNNNS